MSNLMNNINIFDLHIAGLHPASTYNYADLLNKLRVDAELGRVNSRAEGDYELFYYNSYGIFDVGWSETALLARGLVLDHKRKKIAAMPFPKFFNYGEVTTELPETQFTVTDKMDGCCDEDVIIYTENGEKTIKDICENKYLGNVACYNIDTDEIELKPIIGHSIQDNNYDWYEIELESGKSIVLTGNHKVWLPSLNCYRKVEDLKGDEEFLLTEEEDLDLLLKISKIKSIKKLDNHQSKRYDIEVKDNHNFFANDILVHNSLGIAYWFGGSNGYWSVNTRGSFESDQARWATSWLNTQKNITDNLVKGNTYLFEIIYPENKIVVAYDFAGLVLLGAYHRDGYEYERYELEELRDKTGVKLVDTRNFNSVEDMLEKAKELSVNEEGWVLTYPCGYRVKIKGDEYCRVHRLISNCTPLSVWNSFKMCDDFDVLKRDLPEEFRIDLDNMNEIFTEKFNKKLNEVKEWMNYTKNWSDRDIGLASANGEIPRHVTKWIFASRKKNFLAEVEKASMARAKFCEDFRPNANYLEGYTPTSAMNRFEADAE